MGSIAHFQITGWGENHPQAVLQDFARRDALYALTESANTNPGLSTPQAKVEWIVTQVYNAANKKWHCSPWDFNFPLSQKAMSFLGNTSKQMNAFGLDVPTIENIQEYTNLAVIAEAKGMPDSIGKSFKTAMALENGYRWSEISKLNHVPIKLDLSSEHALTALPDVLTCLRVTKLNLQNVPLFRAPSNLPKYQQLEVLNLQNTRLKTLGDTVKEMKVLKHLDLSYNPDLKMDGFQKKWERPVTVILSEEMKVQIPSGIQMSSKLKLVATKSRGAN